VKKRPGNWRARYNFISNARPDDEKVLDAEFAELERIAPNHAYTLLQRGARAYHAGRPSEAITPLTNGIQRTSAELPTAHALLGAAYLMNANLDQAEFRFRRAVALDPRTATYAARLALTLTDLGRPDEARPFVADAIRLDPELPRKSAEAARQLALTDPSGSDGRDRRVRFEAVFAGRIACLLTDDDDPDALDSLAIAYAADGRFPDAVRTARLALEIARRDDRPTLAAAIELRLRLYEQKKPYTRDNARRLAAGLELPKNP
jgi:tetratricopeptide (TPR) repeat protein